MQIADFKGKKIAIWGMGREGVAAAAFIRQHLAGQPVIFVDENESADPPPNLAPVDRVIKGMDQIRPALHAADLVIKSPGVSLYHPLVQSLQSRNVPITSLLNLWFALPRTARVIAVTGTKGKSTTSSLLAHALGSLGKKTALLGNIGVPVTYVEGQKPDYIVLEVSSYQAADFSGTCEIGVLTSLYPEHLDWHRSLDAYYRDKLNLLKQCRRAIINCDSVPVLQEHNITLNQPMTFGDQMSFHVKNNMIYLGTECLGVPDNRYLARPHNLINVCAVLAVIRQLGLDPKAALRSMRSFVGLPHRQQEIGEKEGILYVDDSISTTPQSAIAAMEAYPDRAITLIAGGYDRGIDYKPLIDFVVQKNIHAIICMGKSGQRIFKSLREKRDGNIYLASTLEEAFGIAKKRTAQGGVVLLSPAAPSYGMFKNFEERGERFAALVEGKAVISKIRNHA